MTRQRSRLADLRSGLHDMYNLTISDRYLGALSSKILKTNRRIFKNFRDRICKQCKSYIIGDISSNLPCLVTSRAAEFWMDWSFFIS